MIIRVGITGVGGGVGQSIIKALQISGLQLDITAIDMTWDSAGMYMDGVRKKKLSNLKGKNYPESDWHTMVYGGELDCIIPGSDYDLKALSNVKDEWGAIGCKVLVSDYDLVLTCEDKLVTCQELCSVNLPYPQYDEVDGFPLMIKPRIGSGSRGAVKIDKKEDMPATTDDLIVQEYLDGPEYTCSVFVDRYGDVIGTFQFRRELNNGTTYKGKVVFERDIHRLLVKIGAVFQSFGMLNVQLIKTNKGPVPFEINCRCSGTTAIRAKFGYNEPEMLIRHYVLGENLKTPKIKYGKAFRYWNETYQEVV